MNKSNSNEDKNIKKQFCPKRQLTVFDLLKLSELTFGF